MIDLKTLHPGNNVTDSNMYIGIVTHVSPDSVIAIFKYPFYDRSIDAIGHKDKQLSLDEIKPIKLTMSALNAGPLPWYSNKWNEILNSTNWVINNVEGGIEIENSLAGKTIKHFHEWQNFVRELTGFELGFELVGPILIHEGNQKKNLGNSEYDYFNTEECWKNDNGL